MTRNKRRRVTYRQRMRRQLERQFRKRLEEWRASNPTPLAVTPGPSAVVTPAEYTRHIRQYMRGLQRDTGIGPNPEDFEARLAGPGELEVVRRVQVLPFSVSLRETAK